MVTVAEDLLGLISTFYVIGRQLSRLK